MTTEMLDSIVSSHSQELPNASSALKLFENPQFRVRVIMRCADPWFVAKDACDCLAIADASQACQNLDDDEKQVVTREFDSLLFRESKAQAMTLISESGLYTLIMRSNKPEAKVFRKWVTSEVLPSIRKTGSYSVAQTTLAIPKTLPEALRAYADEVERREAAEKRAITAEVERDEAIRTKAQIGSSREATAMATASAKSRECEKLREQIGDSETYKRATAIPWLSEYFDTRNDGLYNSLAHQLKKIEASMPPEFAHKPSPDSRFGSVKAYHIAVIERLHEIVREKIPVDEKFMAKYRKEVSVQSENT